MADFPKFDFLTPRGEPALCAPDSVSWRVFKNPIALATGGVAAVLLEFAEPRVRDGVWQHSTFPTDPLARMRRTGMAAMATIYGAESRARELIAQVGRMHARVSGTTSEGTPYRALDKDLLDWVQATATYGFTMGCQLIAKVKPGERYQAPDGSWRTRGAEAPLRDNRCPAA